jgi:hypothetical protein
MHEWGSPQRRVNSSLARRLDRVFGRINKVLMVVAIGLSVFYLTYSAASRVVPGLGLSLAKTMVLHPTQDTATAADFQ